MKKKEVKAGKAKKLTKSELKKKLGGAKAATKGAAGFTICQSNCLMATN